MLSIIVAIANNNVIGNNNNLIWHIPEDLKRFKKITMNKKIIMGRKTFNSLPGILPNREHIVLSMNPNYKPSNENIKILSNLEDLAPYITDKEEHFIIGGGIIYKLLLPYCSKLYITKIHHDFKGDTFFPNYDAKDWQLISSEKGIKNEKNPYNYEYLIYNRKTSI